MYVNLRGSLLLLLTGSMQPPAKIVREAEEHIERVMRTCRKIDILHVNRLLIRIITTRT